MADAYSVVLTRAAYRHLEGLRRYDRNRVLDAIRDHLAVRPTQETRHKKPLRENPLADWELRVQPFRVFYDVDPAAKTVRILAIGHKQRDRLIIGGQEIQI